MKQYTVITAAEAKALWRLKSSTLNTTIARGQIPTMQSGKTHLILTGEISKKFGAPLPEECLEKGKFLKVEDTAMMCSGCVPGDSERLVFIRNDIYVVSKASATATRGVRWLLNSPSIPAGGGGTYNYEIINTHSAIEWVRRETFESRIGYAENARLLADAAGIPVPVNRAPHAIEVGDEALVMRLPYRINDVGSKGKTQGLRLEDFEFGILVKIED